MRTLLLPLTVVIASTAVAQAPVITPAGDPSVRNDTIYRLAVNPADYPDEPYVYLLDDGVVRFDADGRGSRTYRQVIQVLKQEAASQFGEQVFSYSRSREKLTVNWVRVVRPDGSVVSDSAAHEQESDAPTALTAPVYSDARLHRVTLGGVAEGTVVDWSYTVETLDPMMAGDFFTSWRTTVGHLTRRSRFLLDLPASLSPRIVEHNMRHPGKVMEAGGRRVWAWVAQDVPKAPEPEPFGVDSNDFGATVTVTSPEAWADVARWYWNLSRDRYTVNADLDVRLSALVGAQKSGADTLRALYRWVAQDFRYVSVSLGLAGFQPREPAATLETRYGDCKDKATLFIALARRMGFPAYPVLLGAGGGLDSSLVSIRAFNHMIVAVRAPGHEPYLYLDPTLEAAPIGVLPSSEAGQFALVVHQDGSGEQVSLPLDSVEANRAEVTLTGEVSPDGNIAGRVTETFQGPAQLPIRALMSRDYTATQRADMVRSMAGGLFEGAVGDSLQLFDGRDLAAEARITYVIRGGKATTSAGTTEVLTLPGPASMVPTAVSAVAAHVPRRYHIAASRVLGAGERVVDLHFVLPEGWKARLPSSVSASSVFGTYSATFAQEGRDLHIVRRAVGARGVYPPDRVNDLLAFLRDVARDDARFVVIEHP